MFLEALDKQGASLSNLAGKVKQFLDSKDEKVSLEMLKVVIKELIGNKAHTKDAGFEQQLLQHVRNLKEGNRGQRPSIS
jgi:hypothetical protein